MENKCEFIKLVILGDEKVGKSSFLEKQLKTKKFLENYVQTIGIDYFSKNFQIS